LYEQFEKALHEANVPRQFNGILLEQLKKKKARMFYQQHIGVKVVTGAAGQLQNTAALPREQTLSVN
jgi:hypothetical protein